MKKKLSGRFWCALTLFSLIGQIAWVIENMYLNVFIYNMFSAKAAHISLMVSLSAISAALTTVFIGALADKIGKRKLFICSGYILWGVSIFCFALIRADILKSIFPMSVSYVTMGISLTIALDCLMTFFGSSANDAAFNAWLTDSTDPSNRGSAEGINAMMPLVAVLVVFGSFMFFDLTLSKSWAIIFTIIGVAVICMGILGIFIIKEPNIKPSDAGYFSTIFYGFRPSTIRCNKLFYIILIGFAIFNISIQIFMPYLIIYYEKSLKMSNYVFIMAPAIILASVVTAVWGKIYDKKGFKFSVIISLLWLSAGYLILFFSTSTALVFIGSLLMMCGYLSGMAVFGAAVRDYTPAGKAGAMQGLRIFAQVLIPGIIGPAIGAFVLKDAKVIVNNDGTSSFLPNEFIFLAACLILILIIPILLIIFKKQKPPMRQLTTPFENELDDIPWKEYPRPDMKRDSYMCLNGKWNLKIQRKRNIVYDGEILVPFSVESRLSGVQKQLKKSDVLVYSRTITLTDSFTENEKKGRLLLHFGAVDQVARVMINDVVVGEHTGGYIPFYFDITDIAHIGENTLTVEVIDNLCKNIPYGKQRKKRGGMWYTPISGIWQTVWLEKVPDCYIKSIHISPIADGVIVKVDGGTSDKKLIFENKEYIFTGDTITIQPENPHLWTAEDPYLYDFEVISGEDRIKSYFAIRNVKINNDKILINNKPDFFHGLLDQGYYSDGIYLPATEQGYINDILKVKEMGFNCLRKHIKIEPKLFYYYCDKYGMYVFQDFVNNGKYNFLIDTALPTIGIKKGISHFASKARRDAFEQTAVETINLLYNHPCVCYYTIFNEGWGQYSADEMYDFFKGKDDTRVWDTTSGWFKEKKSDVISEHIYFKPVNLKKSLDKKPIVLSEFGGYSLKIDDHSFNPVNTYGYRFFTDKDAYTDALRKLYCDEIIGTIKSCSLCACIFTQVSDVEDETNGLMTYDRMILKIDVNKMKEISDELYEAYKKVI